MAKFKHWETKKYKWSVRESYFGDRKMYEVYIWDKKGNDIFCDTYVEQSDYDKLVKKYGK